jgi:cyclophilin family peptidyl-prolyl cis-trans isomerase
MRYALNSLNQAAYLSLPYRRLQDCSLRGSIEAAKAQNAPGERLPRLVGRCVVTLEFRRGGGQVRGRGAAPAGDSKALVRVVVDGIYHPVTAGNFIDLVKAGRYDDIEVREGTFELPGQALRHLLFGAKGGGGEGAGSTSLASKSKAKAGSGKDAVVDGYVYSGKRRLPLEILRETADPSAPSKRFVAYGNARNSAVFTNSREQTQLDPSLGFSPTVNSFATYGALGMFHSREDAGDGGLEFFVLPRDELGVGDVNERDASPAFRRLSSKYSLFAYCVDRNDVLSTLRAGDVLVSATAEPGVWELLR